MRKDEARLAFVADKLKETYSAITNTYINPEEDYGVDINVTGWTKAFGIEVKTASEKYGSIVGDYWVTGSTTNEYWRWGYTADTKTPQDIISADTTPRPSYMEGKPLMILNAVDKYGNPENAKIHKLLKTHQCLVYLGLDGFILFSPKALREALIGYGYLYCRHTKEFGDNTKQFELKAILDMSKAKFIPCDVDRRLLN